MFVSEERKFVEMSRMNRDLRNPALGHQEGRSFLWIDRVC